MRSFLLGLIVLAVAGCSSGHSTGEAPPSGLTPPPSPPGVSHFNTGSPDERPIVQQFLFTNAGQQTGWTIVPATRFSLVLQVEKVDRVTFHAYVPGEQEFDPEQNGVLGEGSAVREGTSGRTRWVAQRETPGGNQLAIYAVAENQHGRTVSPVVFVVMSTEIEPSTIKEP